jgi:hypothetical protein
MRRREFIKVVIFWTFHGMFSGYPMLHHVEINVLNLSASRAFWSEILGKLGYKLSAHGDERFTLSNDEDPPPSLLRPQALVSAA